MTARVAEEESADSQVRKNLKYLNGKLPPETPIGQIVKMQIFRPVFSLAKHRSEKSTKGVIRRRWRMCILVVVQDCKSVVDTQIVDDLQY